MAVEFIDEQVAPWRHGRRLGIGLSIGRGNVEEMDFSVEADLLALGVEHDGGVVDTVILAAALHQATGMDPDRVILCELLNEEICFATWYAVRRAPLVGDRPAKPVEMFRQHDQIGSADHSLAHQPLGFGKIMGPIGLRTHLNEGDFQDLGSWSKSKIDRPEAK